MKITRSVVTSLLTLLVLLPFSPGISLAKDPTCNFPLIDEPTGVSGETCSQVLQEPYQKNFLKYVCLTSCSLEKCLADFAALRAEPAFADAYTKVETSTANYPKERLVERCGSFDPKPPEVNTTDDKLWDQFHE